MSDRPVDISALLRAWGDGDSAALARLTPIVYDELHRLARAYMRRERKAGTLQTSALVNEAWMRLVDCQRVQWHDREHFFAVSARLMRRILVDHARRRNQKRGRDVPHVPIDDVAIIDEASTLDMVALDDALTALAGLDARKAQVVEMKFFGGLTVEEIARVLRVSPVTVMREWRGAKAWLYRALDVGAVDGA